MSILQSQGWQTEGAAMDDGINQNHGSLRHFVCVCLICFCWATATGWWAHRQAGDDLAGKSRDHQSQITRREMMKSDRKGIAPLHVWLYISGGWWYGSYKCSITSCIVWYASGCSAWTRWWEVSIPIQPSRIPRPITRWLIVFHFLYRLCLYRGGQPRNAEKRERNEMKKIKNKIKINAVATSRRSPRCDSRSISIVIYIYFVIWTSCQIYPHWWMVHILRAHSEISQRASCKKFLYKCPIYFPREYAHNEGLLRSLNIYAEHTCMYMNWYVHFVLNKQAQKKRNSFPSCHMYQERRFWCAAGIIWCARTFEYNDVKFIGIWSWLRCSWEDTRDGGSFSDSLYIYPMIITRHPVSQRFKFCLKKEEEE